MEVQPCFWTARARGVVVGGEHRDNTMGMWVAKAIAIVKTRLHACRSVGATRCAALGTRVAVRRTHRTKQDVGDR
jgi:hypothetical protein